MATVDANPETPLLEPEKQQQLARFQAAVRKANEQHDFPLFLSLSAGVMGGIVSLIQNAMIIATHPLIAASASGADVILAMTSACCAMFACGCALVYCFFAAAHGNSVVAMRRKDLAALVLGEDAAGVEPPKPMRRVKLAQITGTLETGEVVVVRF